MELDNTSQKITGVVRSVVQAFFASLIVTITPVLEALDIVDEITELAALLTSVIVAVVLGAYWWLLTTLSQHPVVTGNAILTTILAALMGGRKTPTYLDAEVVDN